MNELRRQMRILEDKIERKLHLEENLYLWKNQIAVLTPQVRQLQTIMDEEQSDVERLEKPGIGSMVHMILGTIDEKMGKERREADEAMENFSCAAENLDRLEALVRDAMAELELLQTCREEYLEVLKRQVELMEQIALQMTEQPEAAGKRLQLERRRRSIREALLLSRLLLHSANLNAAALDAARTLPEGDLRDQAGARANYEAETIMELATKLQAKLAQMGIDPRNHLLVGPYFRSPAIYLLRTGDDTDRFQEAADQIDFLQKDTTEIRDKLLEALDLVESAIDDSE